MIALQIGRILETASGVRFEQCRNLGSEIKDRTSLRLEFCIQTLSLYFTLNLSFLIENEICFYLISELTSTTGRMIPVHATLISLIRNQNAFYLTHKYHHPTEHRRSLT